jgi:hypothetical protein
MKRFSCFLGGLKRLGVEKTRRVVSTIKQWRHNTRAFSNVRLMPCVVNREQWMSNHPPFQLYCERHKDQECQHHLKSRYGIRLLKPLVRALAVSIHPRTIPLLNYPTLLSLPNRYWTLPKFFRHQSPRDPLRLPDLKSSQPLANLNQ